MPGELALELNNADILNLARVRGGDGSKSQKMLIINIEWFKGSLISFIPLQTVLS